MKKGPATHVANKALVLVLEEQIEGINGTPETLGWHYKKGKQPTVKDIQQQWIRVQIIEKTLLEFKKKKKKGEKGREIPSVILKQPLESTLGFKGIKTLQVLEAWRAI